MMSLLTSWCLIKTIVNTTILNTLQRYMYSTLPNFTPASFHRCSAKLTDHYWRDWKSAYFFRLMEKLTLSSLYFHAISKYILCKKEENAKRKQVVLKLQVKAAGCCTKSTLIVKLLVYSFYRRAIARISESHPTMWEHGPLIAKFLENFIEIQSQLHFTAHSTKF